MLDIYAHIIILFSYGFQVFHRVKDAMGLKIHEDGKRSDDKQEKHTMDSAKLLEFDLKQTLLGMTHKLFWERLDYLLYHRFSFSALT